jgi:hypothetical protein
MSWVLAFLDRYSWAEKGGRAQGLGPPLSNRNSSSYSLNNYIHSISSGKGGRGVREPQQNSRSMLPAVCGMLPDGSGYLEPEQLRSAWNKTSVRSMQYAARTLRYAAAYCSVHLEPNYIHSLTFADSGTHLARPHPVHSITILT